jgi:UPF0755 protein
MSDSNSLSDQPSPTTKKSHQAPRRTKKTGFRNFLVLVGIIVAIGLVAPRAVSMFSSAPDFPGPGTGSVQIQIEPGATLAKIGNDLKALGVVASVDGFIGAANKNQDSANIAPGSYNLLKEMKSSDAILALLDPVNRVVTRVVIPEGKRTSWTIAALVEATGIPVQDFEAAVANANNLGLPDYANGNIEGFLFPATYEFASGTSAEQMISAMLAKFNSEVVRIDLDNQAKAMGRTPYEILIIASLLEVEGAPRDFTKVAQVVYNRLAEPMRLQFDSIVNYGLNKTDVILTTELLNTDTPYNSYLREGLPPTPIDAPGAEALEAALNPEPGDWLYFITVDLNTQETKFTRSYPEFLIYKDEFLAFCAANDGVCY